MTFRHMHKHSCHVIHLICETNNLTGVASGDSTPGVLNVSHEVFTNSTTFHCTNTWHQSTNS